MRDWKSRTSANKTVRIFVVTSNGGFRAWLQYLVNADRPDVAEVVARLATPLLGIHVNGNASEQMPVDDATLAEITSLIHTTIETISPLLRE